MADSTDAAPGVVVSQPIVGDPAAHAAAAKVSADALTAQAETVTDADGITSLDSGSPVTPANGKAKAGAAPEGAAPTLDPEPAADEAQAEGESEGGQAAAEEEAVAEGEAEGEGEGEETTADMLVFDFGGNKLEVPKDSVPPQLATQIDQFVKGTWTDYTRKSQQNAEVAKSNLARGEGLEKMAGLNGEALETYSTGLLLRTEIGQLQQINLQALWQSANPADHDQARQISDTISKKQALFQDIVARVGAQEAALDGAHQAELDRRSGEGRTVLNKRIKDFSSKHAPEVVAYAVSCGMSEAEANNWALNPMMTEMGWKSMLYDRMQASTAKSVNGSPRAQASTAPAMKAKGASSDGSSDPDKMPMSRLATHLGLPG